MAARCSVALVVTLVVLLIPVAPVVWAGPPFWEFVDPNPAPGNQFGFAVVALSTGNVVVTAPFDDSGGPDAGAVYLFNGATGALISTLKGATANDNVGFGGVIALTNGNFAVLSPNWDNGPAADAGAVTWGSGTAGITGFVSAANSLVGTTASDRVGASVTALTNGNYVVSSPNWDNGAVQDAGAVTWGSGTVGISGAVSTANSLVGTATLDRVGEGGVIALTNGNYLVRSRAWDNGAATDAGAVTWGNGTTGIAGAVSAANSLVGSTGSDSVGGTVGSNANGNVLALPNGNYVVSSPRWDNGAVANAGAVTWGNGTAGVSGTVTPANSLVGSAPFDQAGAAITVLTNGNYVVQSGTWANGIVPRAGAVTWGNGMTGLTGPVSAANSLIGSTVDDFVGSASFGGSAVTALANGNYVVRSPSWDNAGVVNVGAVTWGDGAAGTVGVVSGANSLVGTQAADAVGNAGVTALTNGNYVVRSVDWKNGVAASAGAVTWGNGTTGTAGEVGPANSLVGSKSLDGIGAGVTALSNGNYVVTSYLWDNGVITNAGAVTWGNGSVGTIGVLSAFNSLVGTTANDRIGFDGTGASTGVTALSNGNYVVRSPEWRNGGSSQAGAVTWGNGTLGTTGPVSAANSLVGATISDRVGNGGVFALANGNYAAVSPEWDGAVTNAGAVTWGNGSAGVTGLVSSSNSLVGGAGFDSVGNGGVTVLSNGHYVVRSGSSDNVAPQGLGAVTWANGSTGISGAVSFSNSLVEIGTLGGVLPVVLDNINATFLARFRLDTGGKVRVGSQIDGVPNQPPAVLTGGASLLTDSTATLNGTVNPIGKATTGFFQYGLTSAYGTTTGSTPLGSGSATVGLNSLVESLACNTLYHFRAVAVSAAGTTNGADNSFTTSACTPPPTVTSDAATDFTQTGATLNGIINPNGGVTNRRFEYGPTAAYGSTSSNLAIGSGLAPVNVSVQATGLACNTLHHFRAVGQNGAGVVNGGDLTFTTAACPPAGSNNIGALTARAIPIDSTSQDTMSDVRAEIWYRVRLFASRSYQFSAWPVDHEQGVDAPALSLSLFSDDAGTVLATPAPVVSSLGLEGAPNDNGDALPASLLFQPTVSGIYKIRILRSSGGSAAHSINVAARETTLFSPWTSRAAGFEGFIEMRNNTNAAVNVMLRAFDNAGVQQGAGLAITLQPNATDFRTANQVGVPVNVFAGIVLTHDGALGAVAANITTLNGAVGLSFDSPFTTRNTDSLGTPVR